MQAPWKRSSLPTQRLHTTAITTCTKEPWGLDTLLGKIQQAQAVFLVPLQKKKEDDP